MMSKHIVSVLLLAASSTVSAAPQGNRKAVKPSFQAPGKFYLKIADSHDDGLNGQYVSPMALNINNQTRISYIAQHRPEDGDAGPMSILSSGKLAFDAVDENDNTPDRYAGGFSTSGGDRVLYFAEDRDDFDTSDFVTFGTTFSVSDRGYLQINGKEKWAVCLGDVDVSDGDGDKSVKQVDTLTFGVKRGEGNGCRKCRVEVEAV